MAGFQVSPSSYIGMMMSTKKNSTILLLLLLLVTTSTYFQQVYGSRSMPPAPTAPATSESVDHNNIKSEDEGTAPATSESVDHNNIKSEDGGAVYMVGDEGGWTVVPGCGLQDFQAWADAITFHPGDTLRFWYSNSSDNSLIKVNQKDYNNCNLTSPLFVYPSNGDIYVKLEQEGDYYFVSGSHNYCNIAFQKVHVKVVPRSPLPPRLSAALAPAPASYADDHMISGATSSSPTQSWMSTWIVFGLSLLVVISYV